MVRILKVKYYTEEGLLMVEYNKGRILYKTTDIEKPREHLQTAHGCTVRFTYREYESIRV
jgi:hypothetical protein